MSACLPGGSCVLIIDDEKVLCDAIAELVRSRGYDAVTVYNGIEAMELLRRQPQPALILLDLYMPGVTGWKFRQMQLLHPQLAEVPVVVTSSLDPSAQRRQELGDVDYLDKSHLWENLPAILERFCGPSAAAG